MEQESFNLYLILYSSVAKLKIITNFFTSQVMLTGCLCKLNIVSGYPTKVNMKKVHYIVI
jgi:hypothetical protein